MTNKDLDDLRQQTEGTTRLEDTAPEQEFVDLLADELESIQDSRANKVVSANDPEFWALLSALERDADRRATFLDRGNLDDDASNSEILRHLIRVGLAEIDPDLKDQATEALRRSTGEF